MAQLTEQTAILKWIEMSPPEWNAYQSLLTAVNDADPDLFSYGDDWSILCQERRVGEKCYGTFFWYPREIGLRRKEETP